VKKVKAPLDENIATKGAEPVPRELTFRYELLTEMQNELGISDAEVQALIPAGEPQEKGPLNWHWVHAILKALDRTPLRDKLLDEFTRDVFVYLDFPNVTKAIDNVVLPELQQGPCVVVAHSLGTVVGYNALSKAPATTTVTRFITVGSPLGIRAIKNKLKTPLAMPPCTASWFNARDPDDVVSLFPLDDSHFGIKPAINNKNDVDNKTDNQHGIAGYLNDPEVARHIHAAIIGS
jgi:pimeloyl-ACP methyl ester carboxylesterase